MIIFSCIILIYALKSKKEIHVLNTNIDKQNNELIIKNKELQFINSELRQKQIDVSNQIQEDINRLNSLNQSIQNDLEDKKALSQKALENYYDVLDEAYLKKEQAFQLDIDNLKTNFELKRQELEKELKQIQTDLNSIKATRAAAIEAKRKEKEIKEKNKFYMLSISSNNIEDIKKLNRIKQELHNPRVLSMLIWSTFFQKSMTNLCNNILGTNTITGIYKITNQIDDMCYIGQSVDIATRWKSHAKCGLGIDTPADNKLYKAMLEEGIWNFSWELLEECPKEKLNEKEKFYIELYQSKNFGYNSTKGNK